MAILICVIFISPSVSPETSFNFLSKGYADTLYCPYYICTTLLGNISTLGSGNTTQEMITAVNTTGFLIDWSDHIIDTNLSFGGNIDGNISVSGNITANDINVTNNLFVSNNITISDNFLIYTTGGNLIIKAK